MTASRDTRAGFFIVLLAALFTYGLIRLFDLRFATGDVYPEGSSMRASPDGAKLLYDSLARTPGVSVARSFTPLDYIDGPPATVILLALEAGIFAAEPDDNLQDIEKLAGRGHRVVVGLKWEGEKAPEHAEGLAKRWHLKYALDPDKKHAHRFSFADAADWSVVERNGPKLLALEHNFGKGSVVLMSESNGFENAATVKLDRMATVLAALGPNNRVIFDEQHLGMNESGTVVGLARRFHLGGMALGLAICAALFIWKNAAGFPPPIAAERADTFSGRTSIAGLDTLLRRHIRPADLAATCWNEWLTSHRGDVTPERVARAQAILRDHGGRPLDAVREIQTVLHTKGPL